MPNLIFTIEPYNENWRGQLLSVWENSVLATHDFLSPGDFEEIKNLVYTIDFNQFQVFCAVSEGKVLGFLGVADKKIEMLFVDPEFIGKGIGKKLMQFALNELKADTVDVNEQNSSALKFYEKSGFVTFERTATDDQGRNYPLLRMRLTSKTP